jgi:hypothetical protein
MLNTKKGTDIPMICFEGMTDLHSSQQSSLINYGAILIRFLFVTSERDDELKICIHI